MTQNDLKITVNRQQSGGKVADILPSIKFAPKLALPTDFFEKILECEVTLKTKFDLKVLHKLISYYSRAIEYYESIDDPKYVMYNQSLNLLFAQPEVKKYMLSKNSKKIYKKDQVRQRLAETEKDETKMEEISKITKNNNKDKQKELESIINKDIEGQKSSFKAKLEAKKKKYKLSSSDVVGCANNFNALKNVKSDNNKSFDNAKKDNADDVNNIFENENILDDLKKEDKFNDLDDNFEKQLELENSENKNNKLNTTNKTAFLDKMKINFDVFISDYYEYFLRKNIKQIVKDFDLNAVNFSQNLCDSSVNYLNQMKEMQFLITADSDETYRAQIETIVSSLKDEDLENRKKMQAENDDKVQKLYDKYINNTSINNTEEHDINMLKQNLKLDTTKSVNSVLFK